MNIVAVKGMCRNDSAADCFGEDSVLQFFPQVVVGALEITKEGLFEMLQTWKNEQTTLLIVTGFFRQVHRWSRIESLVQLLFLCFQRVVCLLNFIFCLDLESTAAVVLGIFNVFINFRTQSQGCDHVFVNAEKVVHVINYLLAVIQ